MKHPTGPCPVCKQMLKPSDDIVICPECGAPYHRACYQQAGHCVFEDLHASGFEFASSEEKNHPPAAHPPDGIAPPPTPGRVNCPACGAANDARNIFCEQCGTALHLNTPRGSFAPPGGTPGGWQSPFSMGGQAPTVDESIPPDDIPAADWTAYIGPSAPVYLLRFQQQDARKSNTGFIFSAFLLGPFYFAYRKMWGLAALSFVIWMLLSIPGAMMVMSSQNNPLLAGISPSFIENLGLLATILNLAGRTVCGLFATAAYRQNAGKKIKALRAAATDDATYHLQLATKGGGSALGVGLVVAALFLCSFLLVAVAGQDFMNYYAQTFGATSAFAAPLAKRFFLTFWR